MGRRGPPPTPTKVLEARGSWRAKARAGEVAPDPVIPRCPPWVDRDGRRLWREITRSLAEVGLVTKLDRVPMALLVDALTQYLRAKELISTDGALDGKKITHKTGTGSVIQHPAVGIMNKAWERVLKVSLQFGMTPAARAGLKGKEADQSDAAEKFLNFGEA